MLLRFYLLLFFLASLLNAQNIITSKDTTNIQINKIHFLKDQNYKIDDIKNKEFIPYSKNQNELFKFPFENKSSYWIKFQIENKSKIDKDTIIYISYPDIRKVTFYEKYLTDKDFKAIINKTPKDRVFTSKLNLKKYEKKTILIKIENELAPIVFSLEILDNDSFHKKEKSILMLHSIFIGIMIFAIIYFLIAFLMIKKYLYILYIIHIFAMVSFQVFVQGYPKIYVDDLLLLDQIKISMAIITACSYALFVLFFLKDSISKVYRNIIYFFVFVVFISIILYIKNILSAQVTSGLALLEYIMVLIASISAYKKGNNYALSILISVIMIIIGIILHVFAIIFQIIPLYEHTLYTTAYANTLEVLIILFMFVTYFKKTFEEKEKIYLEKLNLEKLFSKSLENEVKLKTKELEKAKKEAEKLARIDELTKLFNRRAFMEEARYLIKESKRYKNPLCLALLDIDHFKKINDTYGHEAGDIVLQSLAKSLSSSIRETDIVARIGGEEFVIIFPHTNIDSTLSIVKKIKEDINNLEIKYKEKSIKITSSFGISELNQNKDEIKSLISKADKALYKAKNTGRNKIEI